MQKPGAESGDIVLVGADIGHFWHLERSKDVAAVDGRNLHIGQTATIDANVPILRLLGAKFDADMRITVRKATAPTTGVSSEPKSAEALDNAQIGNNLTMQCLAVCNLTLRFLGVREDLDLWQSPLAFVNLSHARVGGHLKMPQVVWPELSSAAAKKRILLTLNNEQMAGVVGRLDAFPLPQTDLQASPMRNLRTSQVTNINLVSYSGSSELTGMSRKHIGTSRPS